MTKTAVVSLEPTAADRSGVRLLILASVVFVVLSTWMSVASEGFLEADGVTHYLYARHAFGLPVYFVDVWARPVRMLLHAVPAHFFGLHGVRAASLLAAILCAWVTFKIARQLGFESPAFAGYFVLIQPLLFLHSFSELTEIPFALLAAVAFSLQLSRRWWAFALVSGMMPAARPEGAAFVLLAIALLALHRKWYWIPLTLVPTLLWNHIGWVLFGSDSGPWWRWLIDRFPYSSHSLYAAGPIYRFFAVLPTVVSPLVLPAVLIGTVGVFVARSREDDPTTPLGRWRVPEAWLVAIIPWGILLIHTWLHFTGRMSSSGEPRYLLATSPYWALLACRGWSMLAKRFEFRRPALVAAIIGLAPIAAQLAYHVLPLHAQPDAKLCQTIATWYESSDLRERYPHVYATHPLVYFYLDVPVQGVTQDLVEHPPAGALFVFDSLYASYNSDPRRVVTPELFEANGWTRAPTQSFGLPTQTWIVYLSPQAAK